MKRHNRGFVHGIFPCAMVLSGSGPVHAGSGGTQVSAISRHHLHVPVADTEACDSEASWTVGSDDDAAYSAAVSPSAVALFSHATDLIPEGWPYEAVIASHAVLELPSALQTDATYDVACGDSGGAYTHLPAEGLSPSIKVNQVGFRTDHASKALFLSHWVGELSPLEFSTDELGFDIVDAGTGETILSGTFEERLHHSSYTEDAYGNNYTGATVWQADISSIVDEGEYHLVWEGVGRSRDFVIAPDVYDQQFQTVFRGLFHQRCGMELSAALTEWSHEACHLDPVETTTADYFVLGSDAFSDLPGNATGELIDVSGGYHDAGDYDRRAEHLLVVEHLTTLYELFPGRFDLDSLDIPESGNGVPDVLDEALWAIDIYRQLQGDEGGVRAGVETTGYPDWEDMPEDDPYTEWYAYAEDPLTSYRFAASAARLSRVLESWDAGQAAELLDEAVQAFDWAEAQSASYDVEELAAWAAAELLWATGDEGYDELFVGYSVLADDLDYSPADWDVLDVSALWAYYRAEGGTSLYKEAARSLIISWANRLLTFAEGTGYPRVNQHYQPMSFGSAVTPVEAELLIAAHQLTGDDHYLSWLEAIAGVTLGANPQGLSYVTGVGDHRVDQPLHLPSMGDGIDEP
ncbi:MAG: glycoside hydrolase family 9 protein, partial [Myxococcota bacterium]|nr:glycoside hydrolase family 9 protein [Myxococcota bacterium]